MTLIEHDRPDMPTEAEVISKVTAARRAASARPRRVAICLAIAVAALFCVNLSVGELNIPLADVVPALFGSGDTLTLLFVQDIRLPRTLAALIVGIAFGMSGAIFQAIARNPLASPDLLAINSGASLGAVVMIVVVGASMMGLYVGASAGAVAMAVLVYVLAYRQGVSPYRFVLVGIALGFMALAMITFLLIRTGDLIALQAGAWLAGSLNGLGWDIIKVSGPIVVGFAVLALVLSKRLHVLQLGDETSAGIGVQVERSRAALIAVAVGLVAVAVASAGPVAFVAVMAGPIARRLARSSLSLVSAGLVGALIVLGADLVARIAFAPSEIPVGIITALVGAPFLLWLLARANQVGSGG